VAARIPVIANFLSKKTCAGCTAIVDVSHAASPLGLTLKRASIWLAQPEIKLSKVRCSLGAKTGKSLAQGGPGITYSRRSYRWPLVDFHSLIQELMWTTIARMFHFSPLTATYRGSR
jgi:hypothetical protein